MNARLKDRVIFIYNARSHQTDHGQDLDNLQEHSGQVGTVTIVEHIESPKGDMCRIRVEDGTDLWVWSSELSPISGIIPAEQNEAPLAQQEEPAIGEQLSLF